MSRAYEESDRAWAEEVLTVAEQTRVREPAERSILARSSPGVRRFA
jgi:hypothetical protein